MKACRAATPVVLASLLLAASVSAGFADDWSTFRHDPARSGVSSEQLPAPLHLQWTFTAKHPPQPAWPEPGKEMHRMPFDYAYQVAVADGKLFFGSSAEHKVYALDAATAQPQWDFITDAPVRFSPFLWNGRVFVVSDDGWLYCLSQDDGSLLWKFYGGPRDDRIVGNEHMVSRWPMRSGVVVVDGIAYFTAGMWPAEGVYVYALNAADGSVVWKNDSSGSMYMKLPHPTAEGVSGVAPQGHIVAYRDMLLVPTGRSVPGAFDRETGRLLYYRPAWPSSHLRQGGSWVCAAPDRFFCGCHPGGPDIDVRLGEALPAPGDGLASWDYGTGDIGFRLTGKHRLAVAGDTLYASGSGNVTAYDFKGLLAGRAAAQCVKWESPHERAYSLIVAGDTVLVGGVGTVTAFSGADGNQLWQAQVDGQARGLAVCDGRLYASTSAGRIACFGAEQVADPPLFGLGVSELPETPGSRQSADRILGETRVRAGYCLLLGAGDGQLARQLALQSKLDIYCVEPDAEKAAAMRSMMDGLALHGVRVTVHQADLESLPYPEFFANLVVVQPQLVEGLSEAVVREFCRVLRPYGGTALLLTDDAPGTVLNLVRSAGLTIEESAQGVKAVRGPLPGAGSWTHQYGDAGKTGSSDDELARWPLRLLWFGGPGPEKIISRHLRPSAPLALNGRLFIAGQHAIIAVDAYNGRELWSRDIPAVGRKAVVSTGGNFVADEDSIYAATGSVCFRLDAERGEIRQMYRLPMLSAHFVLDEPRTLELAVDDEHSGTVTLEATAEGLQMKLVTGDDNVTNLHRADNPSLGDSWELFFDLRPSAERGGLYGDGTFQVVVVPATTEEETASYAAGAGSAHPTLTVTGALTNMGGETTVRLPWAQIDQLAGARPADFAFGATLNCSDDGDKRSGRAHRFANADSYRLTNGWASFYLDPAQAPPQEEQPDLLPPEVAERLTWGYISVLDGLLLGSVGDGTEAQYIFALDKADGKLRWLYTAEESVWHDAIAAGDGRVFLVDKLSAGELGQMQRRGETVVDKMSVIALDAGTGELVWRKDSDKSLAARVELSFARGVVLASSRGGLIAYSGTDGEELWQGQVRSGRRPVIVGDIIYAEPNAVALRTGQPPTRQHPLTGDEVTWNFARAYGCGGISASPNLLLFRSGAFGFCDLAGDTGTHNFGGVRPGCYINLIAANGLVLAPNGDSACTCAYNYQTSVALAPVTARNEDWSVFSVPTGAGTRIRQARINLGATGDRRDEEGKMWLGVPRPIYTRAVPVPMVIQYPCGSEDESAGLGYYRHNADDLELQGTERAWLYASGCTGLRWANLDLVVGRPVFAPPCEQAPEIDGVLGDACWDGRCPLPITDKGQNQDARMSAFLRSDDQNLYLAFEWKAAEREGKVVPWRAATTGEDAGVWADDSWQVFITDGPRKSYLHLGVSASGARYDANCNYARTDRIDRSWSGNWTGAVTATEEAWALEMAVPWQVLTEAGLNKDQVRINVLGRNMTGVGAQRVRLTYPGASDFGRCDLFTSVALEEPPEAEPASYTVRLHFVELEGAQPGQRAFDVKLQDQVVLEGIDVVREAGAANTAVVKEFKSIQAGDTLKLELVSRAGEQTATTAPVISAIEVYEE